MGMLSCGRLRGDTMQKEKKYSSLLQETATPTLFAHATTGEVGLLVPYPPENMVTCAVKRNAEKEKLWKVLTYDPSPQKQNKKLGIFPVYKQ